MTATAAPRTRNRDEIDDRHKWNLHDIFPSWAAWDDARAHLEEQIDGYAAFRGTLAQGGHRLLAAFQLNDTLGQLA